MKNLIFIGLLSASTISFAKESPNLNRIPAQAQAGQFVCYVADRADTTIKLASGGCDPNKNFSAYSAENKDTGKIDHYFCCILSLSR